MNASKPLGPNTNITELDRERFNALTSGRYNNFALFSCFFEGQPTHAIVVIDERTDPASGETVYDVTPVYLALTDEIAARITDHDGDPPTVNPPAK